MKLSNFLLKVQVSVFLFLMNIKISFADVIPMKCIPKDPIITTRVKKGLIDEGNCEWVPDIEARPILDFKEMDFIKKTIPYLLATIIFELPVFYLMGFKSKKAILTVILANIITLPLLHFLVFYYIRLDGFWFGFVVIIAELIVITSEGVLLKLIVKGVSWKRSLLASLLANVISAIVGTVVVTMIMNKIDFAPFTYR